MRQATFSHAITMCSALNKLYMGERHPLLQKRTFRTSHILYYRVHFKKE
ncbi:hypothetical protein SAMN02745202_01678 [Segatella oulorum]|uniref:Uncharacterized protein n=1 Tax=Segatella oulorum TaxID=28136 RepID=A0A1T4Q487_9BACT|nr:hypothetical protein SAMN02745202_01678 [Segatella oulorum]